MGSEEDQVELAGDDEIDFSISAVVSPHSYSKMARQRYHDGDDRQRMGKVLERSFRGLVYFGTSYFVWFLEVCAGKAVPTQALRMCKMTIMEPVDITTGWDLTRSGDVLKLKQQISRYRPLLTHLSPVCRIFSTAFPAGDSRYSGDDDYQQDMRLALNICGISE